MLAFGEMSGRPYVVTEPLRGESLHDYLKREHAMPTEVASAMIATPRTVSSPRTARGSFTVT